MANGGYGYMALEDIHEQHRAALALLDSYRGALTRIASMEATTPESREEGCEDA